jgi:hypothetical protein
MPTRRFPGLAREMVLQMKRGSQFSPSSAAPVACPICGTAVAGGLCSECGLELGYACRVCGCTEDKACLGAFGGACSWLEEPDGIRPGLCNAHGSQTTTMV